MTLALERFLQQDCSEQWQQLVFYEGETYSQVFQTLTHCNERQTGNQILFFKKTHTHTILQNVSISISKSISRSISKSISKSISIYQECSKAGKAFAEALFELSRDKIDKNVQKLRADNRVQLGCYSGERRKPRQCSATQAKPAQQPEPTIIARSNIPHYCYCYSAVWHLKG